MKNKKYLNGLDVRESEQVFGGAKVCTLYIIKDDISTTYQDNINIAITMQ